MELNDHGIYKLPDGREFLVKAGAHGGYILHDIRLGVAIIAERGNPSKKVEKNHA